MVNHNMSVIQWYCIQTILNANVVSESEFVFINNTRCPTLMVQLQGVYYEYLEEIAHVKTTLHNTKQ